MFGLLTLFVACIQCYLQHDMHGSEYTERKLFLESDGYPLAGRVEYDAMPLPVVDAAENQESGTTIYLESFEGFGLEAKDPAPAPDGPNTQQLVFGSYHKDNGVEVHYCDVLLKPQRTITSVTVFLKTNENDPNAAVPKCMINPKPSPSGKGFVRLELNDGSIARDGSLYNFQITCSDGTILNTETWTFDAKTGKFSHASAVKRPFYKKKLFKYIASITLGIALLVLSYAIYRSIRKSKATI